MNAGVHQVIAGAAPRDAITNHVLTAREVIRSMGFRSEIFCEPPHIAYELRNDVRPSTQWRVATQPADLAILHYSIDSPAFTDISEQARRCAIHYHNVTPPDLLWRDAPALARQCQQGRLRLGDLAGAVSHAAADSHFNAEELPPLGYPAADVIGVFRQPLPLHAKSVHKRRQANAPCIRMLFVGRGAPNKCQHDAILALAALTQAGEDAELRLVGNWGGNRGYLDRCLRLAQRTGVSDRVHLIGSIPDVALAREFEDADVFVCLSEHEGYCVPLIEAMEAGLPIVGYAAGAVPETMGSAGLLIEEKSPGLVAEAVLAIAGGALDRQMAEGRARQLSTHSSTAIARRLSEFITMFANPEC